jgi:hypothetical protein
VAGVIKPSRLAGFRAQPPFVVLMRADLWSREAARFTSRYPRARTDKVTPDGRLVAVNVT